MKTSESITPTVKLSTQPNLGYFNTEIMWHKSPIFSMKLLKIISAIICDEMHNIKRCKL
jgi:hypothetical protein